MPAKAHGLASQKTLILTRFTAIILSYPESRFLCGCKTRYVPSGQERKLQVFQNKVVGKIFRHMHDLLSHRIRVLLNEEVIYTSYTLLLNS
jgi:hypothetical protein